MSKPTVFSCALVLAILAAGTAPAQEHNQYDPARRLEPITTAEPIPAPGRAAPSSTAAPAASSVILASHTEPSAWIGYQQPGCCTPVGGAGQIFMELYVRNGPTAPQSSGLGEHLATGWLVEAGGRSLFFNQEEIAACTVDLGLLYNFSSGDNGQVPFIVNKRQATVREIHRTAGTLAFGRERYLWGSAHSGGARWRVGFDGGVRWGSTRLDLDNPGYVRINSWNWGPVAAVHSDVEIPRGCCSWIVGVRGEGEEVYNNRFPGDFPHQITQINILFTLGVRY